jgi:hypothetical protein
MKSTITSVKGPSLRRVLCSFLFGAAAFFVVPANSQTSRDIVWVVTGNSIAAYYANGTALPNFNLITSQTPLDGIRVSGLDLYVPSDWWACCPNKAYLYALLHDEAYYMFTIYNAATGSVYIWGFEGGGRAPLFVPGGMSQSGPIFVANQQGSIAQGESFNPFIKTSAPYALAVGGNVLYVTSTSQNSNGNFYISTWNASTGESINPYFIAIPTGGLYGLALKNKVFGVNSALYVSVHSGSAPGVYIYDASTGLLIKEPFFAVNAPWGIAIRGNRLYVASFQDSAIYEFDATTGAQLRDSIKLSGAPTNITVEPATALSN